MSLGDVEYAILETSGEVTVVQKPNKRNTIPEDFGIMPEYEGISYDLIVDGKVMKDNLQKIGKNKHWIYKIMKENNIGELRDIFLLSVTDTGCVTLIRQKQTD